MSIILNKRINKRNYSIFAESWENYRAWGHRAILKINCSTWESKIRYYNRTWESYQYESVIHSVIYDYIQYCKECIKEQYKTDNNIKRITEKHKKNVEKLFKTDKNIKAINRFLKYIDRQYKHF